MIRKEYVDVLAYILTSVCWPKPPQELIGFVNAGIWQWPLPSVQFLVVIVRRIRVIQQSTVRRNINETASMSDGSGRIRRRKQFQRGCSAGDGEPSLFRFRGKESELVVQFYFKLATP